jgi:EAL domain-containing protein (putative c-di-GMP-specific phosphodiesterase class I)
VSVEQDRLGRFLPVLLALTILAACLEGVASVISGQQAFATAAFSSGLFTIGILVAGYQIRLGRPIRARVALAIAVALFGAIGGYLIPDVGRATALLPIVSVILVLPHVPRRLIVPVVAAAIGATLGILVADHISDRFAVIPGLSGIIFQDAILVGVVILVLAGLADFAMLARDSLHDLEASTARQLQVTTARLSIVSALRLLRTLPTPEATAEGIATALADVPLIDHALVLEVSDDGLVVLASVGPEAGATSVSDHVPGQRVTYVMERSRVGAWAELWAGRQGAGIEPGGAAAAIRAQAFAPIVSEDELVGLIIIATNDGEEAIRFVAELPFVSEAATVAGTILAPAVVARQQLRSAKVRIASTIAAGAFHPVFQPIVDLESSVTVGFEALTRFSSGEGPERVFADAARVGLGSELETATLAASVRDAARLPADAWLSLNVSPTFLSQPARLIELLGHRTRPITLEITEHDAIDDYAPIHAAIRALGPDVRLAVDDAGAGVANFGHLVELRPDLVKIDAGLIRGVNADVSRQALIVGLVHFAAVSGAEVLAEGIETQAELETVRRLGVTLGQGYRLARPAPIEEWTHSTPLASPITPRSRQLADVIPIRRRG